MSEVYKPTRRPLATPDATRRLPQICTLSFPPRSQRHEGLAGAAGGGRRGAVLRGAPLGGRRRPHSRGRRGHRLHRGGAARLPLRPRAPGALRRAGGRGRAGGAGGAAAPLSDAALHHGVPAAVRHPGARRRAPRAAGAAPRVLGRRGEAAQRGRVRRTPPAAAPALPLPAVPRRLPRRLRRLPRRGPLGRPAATPRGREGGPLREVTAGR